MALSAPIINFPWSKLENLTPHEGSEINVNLPPGVAYASGTVLGLVTASGNDVQTATITGTPTGGTFTISGTNPFSGAAYTTAGLAFNATGATVQTALLAVYGTGNVTVTGSGGGPYVVTFTGQLANTPFPVLTYGTAGLTGGTPVITNVHTTVGSTAGTYAAYASGNSDGSQVAKLLLSWTTSTDAAGNHYFASTAVSEWGQGYSSVPAYRNGTFRASDLVGLDSTAVGNLGRLVSGTTTTGILQLI